MTDYRLYVLSRWGIAVVAAVSLSLWPAASAAAEGLDGQAVTTACAPVAAPAPSTQAGEIQSLYRQFECHFERGEYRESLPFLEQACRLTNSPRCLLNLGAVHHALLHCESARSYYEQYLDRVPYDPMEGEAQRALQEIRAACPGNENSVTALEPLRPPPLDGIPPLESARIAPETGAELAARAKDIPAPSTLQSELAAGADRSASRRILAWSLLGAGGAAALSTVIVAGYGMRAESDFDSRDRQDGQLGLADDGELRAIDRRGRSYNRLMVGFGVTSAVLLGAGATLWVLELGADSNLSVTSGESALVRYRGRF